MKKRVAVVYGGYSSEFDISRKSAGTIFEHINSEKYIPYLVELSKNSWHVAIKGGVASLDKNKFTFIDEADNEINFDVAFITIHGTPGEDGKLQAYFDMVGLKYINASHFASSLSFNKWACNCFLRTFGVTVAKSILLRKGDKPNPIEIADELGFPCFVKPNDGGSSFGITKVKKLMDMPDAIAKAFAEGSEVVIESFVEGREVTCGLYFNGKDVIALPPTEIISKNEYFDYQAKYEGASKEITPAEIPAAWTKKIQEISKLVYRRMGLRGIARVDFIVEAKTETPYLIEVNTTPGMTGESLVPQQVRAAGGTLTQMFDELLEVGLR